MSNPFGTRDDLYRMLVLYHGDMDGWLGAYLLDRHARLRSDILCDLVVVDYGEQPPSVDGYDLVRLVDFSYSREVMDAMNEQVKDFHVFDHHKSAAEACFKAPYATFDTGKSACRLVWEYLEQPRLKHAPPWYVMYVEDRDLWLWKCDRSREINAVLRSYNMDRVTWDMLTHWNLDDVKDTLVSQGEALLRDQEQRIAKHLRHIQPIRLGNHVGAIVNATTAVSEIAGKLAEGHEFGACWFDDAKNDQIQFSLRRRVDSTLDLSKLATHYGGGGHPAAAGFKLPRRQAIALLEADLQ